MNKGNVFITNGIHKVEVVESSVAAWVRRGWARVDHDDPTPPAVAATVAPETLPARDDSTATLEADSPASVPAPSEE